MARSRQFSAMSAMLKRRRLHLKAKFVSGLSYFSFESLVLGGFNVGLMGSTCTALPCPAGRTTST
jgi:hypothetical protein